MASRSDDSRSFPGFEHIYDLHLEHGRHPYYGEANVEVDELNACHRGEQRPSTPLVVRHSVGRKEPEAAAGIGIQFLLRSDVIDAMREASLTGWVAYPAEVFTKSRVRASADFFLLGVTGRAGEIDWSRSTIVWTDFPMGQSEQRRGLFFEESSWDGSDFFLLGDTLGVVVTERAREVLTRTASKSLYFVRLTEYLGDFDESRFRPHSEEELRQREEREELARRRRKRTRSK